MEKEFYLLLGAAIGAVAAYITAKVTTKAQLNIAQLNTDKDIRLQWDRLKDDRVRSETSIERCKLDILHRTLSRIALENSQTMSYMQSEANFSIEKFRARFLDNCERLHEAMAIVDIYYPKMSNALKQIYGQSNIFWGYQENLLRTDIKTNPNGWSDILTKVLKAGNDIEIKSRDLKYDITERSKTLTSSLEIHVS